MALIICPDCKKQVSDQAPTCPNCGRPIQTAASLDKTQTIEATGKDWKVMQLFGGIFTFIGVVSCGYQISDPESASFTIPVIFLVLGIILMISGKFGAWWYHE